MHVGELRGIGPDDAIDIKDELALRPDDRKRSTVIGAAARKLLPHIIGKGEPLETDLKKGPGGVFPGGDALVLLAVGRNDLDRAFMLMGFSPYTSLPAFMD